LNKIDILIVDDEALLRQGLRAILEKENFVGSIHEANDEATFLNEISSKSIDLILLDVRLKNLNGLELIVKLKDLKKEPKIIVVTGMGGAEVIVNLLRAGVHGIVNKLNGYDEISKSIKAILRSETYFPPNILSVIQANVHRWEEVPSVTLSRQEMELLRGIASGATTKEIADDLKMSSGTAETYRVRLMRKVGVTNTASLLAYAFRNGIL
jgi:DNA-binding NarL/FixJ family response regulator